MFRKINLCVFSICFLSAGVQGQKYVTAGGLRISKNELGLTLQQKVLDHFTIEVLAVSNLDEYYLTVLPEIHNNILWGDGFNSYWGVGPRFGAYAPDSKYIGGDFIMGVEYKMLLFPIVLSADVKPAFRFQEENWFELGAGISFRYVFIKVKKKKLFNKDK